LTSPSSRPNRSLQISVGLLSGSGLLLEIALTRLFSALFYPPYVFAVLSLAVLGLGLGAALATWRAPLRRQRLAPAYAALAGLSTVLLVVLAVRLASLDARALLILLVALPYLFIGLALATLFSRHAAHSLQLYRADLLSAGLGALLAIPLLNLLGPVNGLLVVAALLALAGLVLASGARARGLPAVALLTALLVLGGSARLDWLALDMATVQADKPAGQALARGGQLLATRWDAFARSDLVAPVDGGPYQLTMDGAAGSIMPPAEDNEFLLRDIGLFPFATAPLERVFIIGPGGGLDVYFSLLAQADEIVAVEVNPASVDLVRDFAAYNGDLYGQPAVRVLVDEGRSVLRREATTYDLISLSQVVTLAAERSGYTLTENTVYTVEAFLDYLAHLSPEGQIAIKLYDEATLSRALSTALAALRAQGLSDVQGLSHVAAFLDPRNDPPIPLLLVRKEPFSPDEARELGVVARQVGFAPLFLPGVLAQPPLDAVEGGQMTFSDIVERAGSDISPTSDDRPFFYQFERGIPSSLQPLLAVLAAVVLLGGAGIAVAQRRLQPIALRWAPLYFAALGAGFMLVEIAIIQQVRLFLGHPTLALTTVLAVLLVAGGLGSGLAGRLFRGPGGAGGVALPAWPALAVALLVLAWIVAWPWLNRTFLTASPPVRVLVVVVCLAPLGLVMGMPFPLGLRWVGQADERQVALGWMVNGVMSVAGSAGAVTLAILAGFSRVLLLGLAAYALAALLTHPSLVEEPSPQAPH
jgi:hypothetical protein